MANNRRRGKSVVFDSLPSLVTTEGDPIGYSRNNSNFAEKFSREAVREIIMVLVGSALVVWLFFGGSDRSKNSELTMTLGSRQLVTSDTPFIVPQHFGSSTSSREGVKKAPGDKQGMASLDPAGSKRASNIIYQYDNVVSAPSLVIVTVIDDNKHPREYVEKIIENRVEYAQLHGFGVLIKFTSDFAKFIEESYNHMPTWSRVALALEAQLSFPKAEWYWYSNDNSSIMDSEVNVLTGSLQPEHLEPLMMRQVPVMRYENTHIRTYLNNRVRDVSYVLTQDTTTINTDSFFYRNNAASRIWLQMWSEPLYRTFKRFTSERDALGHMMQWHTQFLVRTAMVNPHVMGSLVIGESAEPEVWNEVSYREGDLVAIISCDYTTEACKREFQKKWNERKRSPKAINQPKEGIQGAKDEIQNQMQVEAQEKAQEKAEKAEKQAAADRLTGNDV